MSTKWRVFINEKKVAEPRKSEWLFFRLRTRTATPTCILTPSCPLSTPSAWWATLLVPTIESNSLCSQIGYAYALMFLALERYLFVLDPKTHEWWDNFIKKSTTNLILRLLGDVIYWRHVQITMKHRKVHYDCFFFLITILCRQNLEICVW